jgi:uncharacterized surface protein with fasciclin (FAS1) repeats
MIRSLMILSVAAAALVGCQAAEDAGNNAAGAGNSQGDSSTGGNSAAATIGRTATQTADLRMFAQAIEAAGLAGTFNGSIPYTVFAPVNSAFEALPAETRTRLMSADGRDQLTQILTHHVVAGDVTSQDLAAALERGQGRATLATIAGPNITIMREGDALVVTDAAGGRARIVQADRRQSNGYIHHIDAVLMPGSGGEGAGNTQ